MESSNQPLQGMFRELELVSFSKVSVTPLTLILLKQLYLNSCGGLSTVEKNFIFFFPSRDNL